MICDTTLEMCGTVGFQRLWPCFPVWATALRLLAVSTWERAASRIRSTSLTSFFWERRRLLFFFCTRDVQHGPWFTTMVWLRNCLCHDTGSPIHCANVFLDKSDDHFTAELSAGGTVTLVSTMTRRRLAMLSRSSSQPCDVVACALRARGMCGAG